MSRVTVKGQVTVPQRVREKLGLRPGDEVDFVEKNGDFILQKQTKKAPFDEWAGYLKHLKGKRVDDIIREMRGE
jgi:AbrB family looped-hinge helix DNA binding protein